MSVAMGVDKKIEAVEVKFIAADFKIKKINKKNLGKPFLGFYLDTY